MSISGSQEVKTAILEAAPAAGATIEESIDAQEDREILGINVSADPVPGGPDQTRLGTNTFIGTFAATLPAAGSGDQNSQDNRSFHYRSRFAAMDDDTNNKAVADVQSQGEWFGHGSGIEWNEDATLTFRAVATGGDANAQVEVYYREI